MPPSSRAIAAACIAILLVVHGLWFAHLFSGLAVDDAYISFRYAASLAHGNGLVCERIRLAHWLAGKMPPRTRIAVYAAGQLAFYSRLYTHDMLGLNDAHIAHVAVPAMGGGFPGHERSDAIYTLDTVRPEVIIDGHRIPGMSRHPTYSGAYVRVPIWTICEVAIRRDVLAGIVRQRGPEFLTTGGPAPAR